MELKAFVGVFKRWWGTLVVAAIVGALCGWFIADRIAPTYETSTRLLVGPINTDSDTLRAAGQLAETYAELATTDPVLDVAGASIGEGDDGFDGTVRATADDVTRIITVSVRGGDAQQVADMANAVATELSSLAASEIARPEGELRVVEGAVAPSSPSAPNVNLIVVLSLLAALVGAAGLALMLEYLADAVQSTDDLLAITGSSFAVTVPVLRRRPSRGEGDLPSLSVDSRGGAGVRVLSTSLELSLPANARSVLLVAADRAPGSPELAANLAATLARDGRTVVLLDATDGQAIGGLFGVDAPGPSSPGGPHVRHAHPDVPGLRLSFIGGLGVGDEAAARAVIKAVAGDADRILVHAAPLPESAGALLWGRACDATILAAQRGVARREAVASAADQLRRVGATIVGAVLVEEQWTPLPTHFGRSRRTEDPAAVPPAATEEPDELAAGDEPRPGDEGPQPTPPSRRRDEGHATPTATTGDNAEDVTVTPH